MILGNYKSIKKLLHEIKDNKFHHLDDKFRHLNNELSSLFKIIFVVAYPKVHRLLHYVAQERRKRNAE